MNSLSENAITSRICTGAPIRAVGGGHAAIKLVRVHSWVVANGIYTSIINEWSAGPISQ